MDIASLLIKHNTDVNATDRWLFTPLHEAAQKGRTQLCALLVSLETLKSIIPNVLSSSSLSYEVSGKVGCFPHLGTNSQFSHKLVAEFPSNSSGNGYDLANSSHNKSQITCLRGE